MKKLKQVTALIGVIVLIALYASTLVIALKGGENALRLLSASIYATVVLPVLLWAYSFVYRLIKRHVADEAKKEAAVKSDESHTDGTDTDETP